MLKRIYFSLLWLVGTVVGGLVLTYISLVMYVGIVDVLQDVCK